MPEDIVSEAVLSSEDLVKFFMKQAPLSDIKKTEKLASLYVLECRTEKINSDIAFAQMCLETGFLSFGGLVTEDMNNYCGLGALDEKNPGISFESEELGVRAHVQHLKGYAAAEPLVNECVDPRFKYINPKGKAPRITDLTRTWAADPEYGAKLIGILKRMYAFRNSISCER